MPRAAAHAPPWRVTPYRRRRLSAKHAVLMRDIATHVIAFAPRIATQRADVRAARYAADAQFDCLPPYYTSFSPARCHYAIILRLREYATADGFQK